MTPYEIMLSESQERMLMVLKPEAEDQARAIFEKWELDFAVVGELTDTGRLICKMDGEIEADLPVAPLSDQAPICDWKYKITNIEDDLPADCYPAPSDYNEVLLEMLATPNVASRRWDLGAI